ncbi:MAG TPA: hypothetical protein VMS17_17835, partial [Gemmataceae bacterium]|nr:hypothetical protein [Gemmataceae bacterium]
MKPNPNQRSRRTALSGMLAAAAALFAAPAAAKALTTGEQRRDDPDEETGIYRGYGEARRLAPDYRLLLPPLWEMGFVIEQIVDAHEDCDGRGESKHENGCLCVKACGMKTPLECFAADIQCNALADDQNAALEDRRRAGWNEFPGQDDVRLLAGFEDLLAASNEALERHEKCSCRFCRDVSDWQWTVELYRDVIES